MKSRRDVMLSLPGAPSIGYCMHARMFTKTNEGREPGGRHGRLRPRDCAFLVCRERFGRLR
jgi:hypothetical protein